MCEFQRVKENELPMCDYTKSPCTLCVIGNGNTYKEAVKAEKGGG